MSIHAVSWALRQDLPPVAKFVLVALCERANSETGQCWPGLDDVAKSVSLSPRSIVSYIGALVRNGYVTKQPIRGKDGKRRNNHYWIMFDRPAAPWIKVRAEEYSKNEDIDAEVAETDEPYANLAHGSSSVDNPVENPDKPVEKLGDHVQPFAHGPCATVCTWQESLAEPEGSKPSTVGLVEGGATEAPTPSPQSPGESAG